jgi:hypothetical protein
VNSFCQIPPHQDHAKQVCWRGFVYRVYARTPYREKKKENFRFLPFLPWMLVKFSIFTVFTADVGKNFDFYRFYRG